MWSSVHIFCARVGGSQRFSRRRRAGLIRGPGGVADVGGLHEGFIRAPNAARVSQARISLTLEGQRRDLQTNGDCCQVQSASMQQDG